MACGQSNTTPFNLCTRLYKVPCRQTNQTTNQTTKTVKVVRWRSRTASLALQRNENLKILCSTFRLYRHHPFLVHQLHLENDFGHQCGRPLLTYQTICRLSPHQRHPLLHPLSLKQRDNYPVLNPSNRGCLHPLPNLLHRQLVQII